MLSLAGCAVIVLAAVCYALADDWPGIALGLALHMSWHVLDGADGDLARLTGTSSRQGEILDGVCDAGGHLILYAVLGYVLAREFGGLGWAMAFASGAARLVQAAFYETQRRQYQFWVYGTDWLRVSNRQEHASAWPVRAYLRLSAVLSTGGEALDGVLAGRSGAEADQLRQQIRGAFGLLLALLSTLSANYRTLGIGVAMLMASPASFIAAELVVLSLVMAFLALYARAIIRSLHAQAASSTSR